jgi:hypothetical protein
VTTRKACIESLYPTKHMKITTQFDPGFQIEQWNSLVWRVGSLDEDEFFGSEAGL